MSLRKAINKKCQSCVCDPLDYGTSAQQIACCTAMDCPLHPVRPITTTVIPVKLLDRYHIAPEQLDLKARALVRYESVAPESGQNAPLLSTEAISEGVPA